jgi:hypothetical protein
MYKGCTRVVQGIDKGCTRDQQARNAGATPEQHPSNALEPPPTQGIPAGLAGVQYPLPYFNGSFTVKVLPVPT